MNNHEITSILQRNDIPVALPDDVAVDIRAQMHAELDLTLDPEATVVTFRSTPKPTPARRWTWIAASFLIAVGATATFLASRYRQDVTAPVATAPAATSPATTEMVVPIDPPTRFLLVACSDFIDSTQFDDRPWGEHFAASDTNATDPTAADFDRLADAIDTLVQTARDVDAARPFLRRASAVARTEHPDGDTVVRQLELAQDAFIREFQLPCIAETAES